MKSRPAGDPPNLSLLLTGLVAAAGGLVRDMLDQALALLCTSFEIEEPAAAMALVRHLVTHSTTFPRGIRPLSPRVHRGVERETLRAAAVRIVERLGSGGCLFLYRHWIPIYAYATSSLAPSHPIGSVVVRVPRFLVDPNEILAAVGEVLMAQETGADLATPPCSVYILTGHRDTRGSDFARRQVWTNRTGDPKEPVPLTEIRIGGSLQARPPLRKLRTLDELWLGPAQRECLEDLEHWAASPDSYLRHGLPWRRGYLFHGPPGTGKTAFALALAQRFGFDVCQFDLATFDNNGLREAWSALSEGGPKLLLFEDFDAIFEGRKNVCQVPTSRVTFDCLLDLLDGAGSGSGCITILTTNRPETLDPALALSSDGNLVSRPGRIDRIIAFETLDVGNRGRHFIAARLLSEMPSLVFGLVNDPRPLTPAQFQELCIRRLLEERERQT